VKTSSTNLKYIFFALFIATQLLLAASSQAQPYQTIITENSIVVDDLSRTVTTVQSGNNTLNRFLMTQVRKAGPPEEAIKGVILLLPPLGSGFQNYEATATATITIHSSHSLRAVTSSSLVTHRDSTVSLPDRAKVV
jgi:hypothetical protein